MAVFGCVVDLTDTAPYFPAFAVVRPHAPAMQGTALSADQTVAERVFRAVLRLTGGRLLLAGCFPGVSSCRFSLHSLEHLPADDPLMVVLDQVHRTLARILPDPLADRILDERLLPKHIAAILFVPQHRGFDTSTSLHPYPINERVKRGEGG